MILPSVVMRMLHFAFLAPTMTDIRHPYRQSTTTSLSESIYNYRQEFGRTYHGKLPSCYLFFFGHIS